MVLLLNLFVLYQGVLVGSYHILLGLVGRAFALVNPTIVHGHDLLFAPIVGQGQTSESGLLLLCLHRILHMHRVI